MVHTILLRMKGRGIVIGRNVGYVKRGAGATLVPRETDKIEDIIRLFATNDTSKLVINTAWIWIIRDDGRFVYLFRHCVLFP